MKKSNQANNNLYSDNSCLLAFLFQIRQTMSTLLTSVDGITIGYIHISACTTRVVQTAAGAPITAVLNITDLSTFMLN